MTTNRTHEVVAGAAGARTKLGAINAGQKPLAVAKTALRGVLDRGARGLEVELPVLGAVWIQLIGNEDATDIETMVFARMKERGIELTTLTALTFDAERAVLTLARAVRMPGDHATPFGSAEDWGQVDQDTFTACWTVYGDVRERLAPFDVPLDEATQEGILFAISKKNSMLLRSYGVAALATYLLTSESQPASSPTPTSSDGESLPAS